MSDQKYSNQIEDFRNLKPYYDLVFENMTSLSTFAFSRDYQKMTDALRELVTNTPDYIFIAWDVEDPKTNKIEKKELDALEILDLIEEKYESLFTDKFYTHGSPKTLNSDDEKELETLQDAYLKFARKLRILINASFTEYGLLPKKNKVRKKQQSKPTKGSSV